MGFLATLKESAAVSDPDVLAALAEIPRERYSPEALAALAAFDMPLPHRPGASLALLSPSPSVHALLLQMLELEPGLDVLVLGGDPYAEALVRLLIGGGTVGGVDVDPLAPARPLFDRILALGRDGLGPANDLAKRLLKESAFALSWRVTSSGPEVVKLIRGGTEFLELNVRTLSPPSVGLENDHEHTPVNVSRLLRVEALMQNAWTGRRESNEDTHFAKIVDETMETPAVVRGRVTAEEFERWETARKAFHCAYIRQSVGDLQAAADLYRASLAVRRTAEAHTFLGWTHSFHNDCDAAIAECHRAIEVDPEFGNPYNDIGAYFLEGGRVDESMPWFEKAKAAKRYCCYFYAYSNLGRAYMLKGMHERARREFEEALRLNPDYELAREYLRRLDRRRDYVA